MTPGNYSNIADQVKQVAIEVGNYLEQEIGKVKADQIESKARNSLVSYVDKTAEKLLVQGLSGIIPTAVFLTEEDTIRQQTGDLRWIIDPLDGTTNFLHGLPVFSISLALEEKNEVVIGVVYDVSRKECFYAGKGIGAFLNGNPIRVSHTNQLKDSLVATGFPITDFNKLETYLKTLAGFMQKTQGVRRMGSAAIDLAYVACGRFDGFYEYNLNPWDVAAGLLLVKEAGGVISDFGGIEKNTFSGQEVIASNRGIYQAFQSFIQQEFYL